MSQPRSLHAPHPAPQVKDRFGEQLAKRKDRLSPTSLAVAGFIDANRHGVLGLSALEIGLEAGTSDATVIRTIQALGFTGLRDLKDTLGVWLSEVESPVEKMSNTTLSLGQDTNATIDFVINSQKAALDALGSSLNREAIAKAVPLIAQATGVGIFGIAANGIIAEYGARLFSRSGIPGKAFNLTGVALAENLLQMAKGDVLIMLLHGRAHREATTTLAEAKRLAVPVVMILGREDASLRAQADASLVLPRQKSQNVALHSQTLFALEALHLGVSSLAPDRSVQTLDRLVTLRKDVRPYSR